MKKGWEAWLWNIKIIRDNRSVYEILCRLNTMLCVIWCHLYNFKNVQNTHGIVLLLAKLQASLQLYKFKLVSRDPKRKFVYRFNLAQYLIQIKNHENRKYPEKYTISEDDGDDDNGNWWPRNRLKQIILFQRFFCFHICNFKEDIEIFFWQKVLTDFCKSTFTFLKQLYQKLRIITLQP